MRRTTFQGLRAAEWHMGVPKPGQEREEGSPEEDPQPSKQLEIHHPLSCEQALLHPTGLAFPLAPKVLCASLVAVTSETP